MKGRYHSASKNKVNLPIELLGKNLRTIQWLEHYFKGEAMFSKSMIRDVLQTLRGFLLWQKKLMLHNRTQFLELQHKKCKETVMFPGSVKNKWYQPQSSRIQTVNRRALQDQEASLVKFLQVMPPTTEQIQTTQNALLLMTSAAQSQHKRNQLLLFDLQQSILFCNKNMLKSIKLTKFGTVNVCAECYIRVCRMNRQK